jgi:hypothetical protein
VKTVRLAAAVLAFVSPATSFRWTRPIQAPPGWVRLELPDDVLDAMRPGLPDLRIVGAAGAEIPYAFADRLEPAERRLAVADLESVKDRETTGIVDRGSDPGLADGATFVVANSDFLKPVRLEASEDRASWKEIANGSIFAVGSARLPTLRFPPNDRRYLRFRLDDRNGAPLRPDAIVLHATTNAAEPTVDRPVALAALPSDGQKVTRYAAALPAANLGARSLRLAPSDAAFSRNVRVWERVFFRDEVCRRLLAEGRIARSPGSAGLLEVPIATPSGKNLEIEIEDEDSPPLEGLVATALVRPRVILFLIPAGVAPSLRYGSPTAPAPGYDLDRALAGFDRTSLASASLGPAEGAAVAPRTQPPRVALQGSDRWTSRQPIRLPASGDVAYLEFDEPRDLGSVRIVDAENRQVPFVVEGGVHDHSERVAARTTQDGSRTVLRVEDAPHAAAADALELEASAPDYFARDVRVEEEERDARGPTGERTLGSARWERRPGERPAALRIPLARPSGARPALRAVIENGDNPSLTLGEVRLVTASSRIDFVFEPGERLFLLSGNAAAPSPSYDLAMVADTILSAPAAAARVEAPAEATHGRAQLARWFWVAIAITALALLLELSRTLKRAV